MRLQIVSPPFLWRTVDTLALKINLVIRIFLFLFILYLFAFLASAFSFEVSTYVFCPVSTEPCPLPGSPHTPQAPAGPRARLCGAQGPPTERTTTTTPKRTEPHDRRGGGGGVSGGTKFTNITIKLIN